MIRSLLAFNLSFFLVLSSIAQIPPLKWAHSFGGNLAEQSPLVSFINGGDIIMAGQFRLTIDFDPGPGTSNLSASGVNTDVFVVRLNPNGDLVWAKSFGGGGTDLPTDLEIDSLGNIYLIGEFSGTTDLDPGPGVDSYTSQGDFDIFLSKLDPNGDLVWARQYGGTAKDEAISFTVNNDLEIFLSGKFRGSADFGLSSFLTSNGPADLFISKIDPQGNTQWAFEYGGISIPMDLGEIASDANGNVYSTGSFVDSTDFGLGPLNNILDPQGTVDMFVSKIDSNGTLLWIKALGTDFTLGQKISVDNLGRVSIAGLFYGIMDFDPGPGTFFMTTFGANPTVSSDIFILKLDANGDFFWAGMVGGEDVTNPSPGNAFSEDVSQIKTSKTGDTYITGYFRNTIDLDPGTDSLIASSNGNFDILTIKISPFGIFEWGHTWGDFQLDEGGSIDINDNGEIIHSGRFSGTVDMDPTPSVLNLTASGSTDMFIQKFSLISSLVTETEEKFLSVFPNPAFERIEINGLDGKVFDLEIIDPSGKRVYNEKGLSDNSINLRTRAPGLYSFRIVSNGQVFVEKVLVKD